MQRLYELSLKIDVCFSPCQNRAMKYRKVFVVGAGIFIAASVFLFPSFEETFAGWAWGLFIAVMTVRPLSELVQRFPLLFPQIWEKIQMGDRVLFGLILRIKFMAQLSQKGGITGIWDLIKKILLLAMQWRRELGILAAVFALAHGAGALLVRNKSLTEVFDSRLWDFDTYWGWGLLAVTLMLPLLLTSNIWSMKFLRRRWKFLQRLSYGAFLATGIHIFLAEDEAGPLLIVGVWAVLWWWMWWKKRKG